MQSSSRRKDRPTPPEIGQLYHPCNKAIQNGLNTFTLGMVNRGNISETNSLTLSIFQLQVNGLVCTLASVLLQRFPSPRDARGGLSQRRTSQSKRRTKVT